MALDESAIIVSKKKTVLATSDASEGTILIQGSDAPVFSDTWKDGVDLICGACKSSVVAHNVSGDQIWDVLFQCHKCGRLSQSRELAIGSVLPPNHVFAPYGRYLLLSTVDLKRGVFAGENAHRVHRKRPTNEGGRTDLSSAMLEDLIDKVRSSVGDSFDQLLFSDALGQKSATPPKQRNALAETIERVRDCARELEKPSPSIDPRSIVELQSLVTVLNRWSGHPLWPEISAGLANEYCHTVITLSAASFLEDAGNSVTLFKSNTGRAADLMLVAGARMRAAVEVKAPRILRWRDQPVTSEIAAEIVSKAVKKAGTGLRGQLSSGESGLLVIGGFHLAVSDLDALENAAEIYLRQAARLGKHAQLLGISVVAIGVGFEAGFNAVGIAERRLSGVAQVRVAKHPGYKGDMNLSTDPRPGLQAPLRRRAT